MSGAPANAWRSRAAPVGLNPGATASQLAPTAISSTGTAASQAQLSHNTSGDHYGMINNSE